MANSRGFTLIEVLVALAVLAIALSAAVMASGQYARGQAQRQELVFARMVAANVIAEARLAERWPQAGERDGDAQIAGRDWRWRLRVSDTPDGDIRRLDASVFAANADPAVDTPIATVTGFAGARSRTP